jgi:murein endopeptidase
MRLNVQNQARQVRSIWAHRWMRHVAILCTRGARIELKIQATKQSTFCEYMHGLDAVLPAYTIPNTPKVTLKSKYVLPNKSATGLPICKYVLKLFAVAAADSLRHKTLLPLSKKKK